MIWIIPQIECIRWYVFEWIIKPTQQSLKVDLLTDKTISLPCVSAKEVHHIIMKMDTKKAVGQNWFLVRYFQLIINKISLTLSQIKKQSFTTGKVYDINNYRPISVLSSISKIIERIVANISSNISRQTNLFETNNSDLEVNT